MTDRHPDDLYDALRDRLADYGQEPPAPLWANIRAQLRPAVAPPQLRRRRRWSPVLLLGLLVAVVGSTYWLWRQNAPTSPIAQRTSAPGTPDTRRVKPNGAGIAPTTPALPEAGRTTGPRATASSAGAKPAATTPGTVSTDTYAANTTPLAASADATATPAGTNAASSEQGVRAGRSQPATRLLAGQPGTETRKLGFGTNTGVNALESTQNARPGRGRAAESAVFALKNEDKPRVRRRAAQAAGVASTAPTGSPVTRAALSGAGMVAKGKPDVTPTGIVDPHKALETMAASRVASDAAVSRAADAPLPAAAGSTVAASAQATSMLAAERVESSPVALQLSAVPGPLVRAQPDSAYLPKLLARRWALLVLAGPALTHRRLGSSNLDQGLISSPIVGAGLPATKPDSMSRRLAQQERLSTGFGVRVQVSRVLNGRWTLSAGLGYQEYASTVETTQTAYDRFFSASTTTSTHRDTYHFLTLPVQAHYALGQAGKRLRYGVVAGVEAAIYLSGSNVQLNGTAKDWNFGNSPYRSLNLALSTGLDVRYRLAPRLEMVVQPTATYFLNPLTRPATGLPPRYLWGGNALVGLSYHLR